jgi:plastocyanin
MLLSKGELSGFGVAIVIVVVMGVIALAGPFHHINKIHAASGPMVYNTIITQPNNPDQMWQFSPRTFTVKVGQPITFRNPSITDHTATARNAAFDSHNIPPGGSWVFTPTQPGTFAYYCAYHAWMTGVLTVVK